jgi:hypothetical protein
LGPIVYEKQLVKNTGIFIFLAKTGAIRYRVALQLGVPRGAEKHPSNLIRLTPA